MVPITSLLSPRKISHDKVICSKDQTNLASRPWMQSFYATRTVQTVCSVLVAGQIQCQMAVWGMVSDWSFLLWWAGGWRVGTFYHRCSSFSWGKLHCCRKFGVWSSGAFQSYIHSEEKCWGCPAELLILQQASRIRHQILFYTFCNPYGIFLDWQKLIWLKWCQYNPNYHMVCEPPINH